jgi:nucleotide-binding universal stress UspA family protein
MTHVITFIDGSASAPALCDYAAWASLRLEAPLTFLHVLDQRQYPVAANLSGHIGLGSREQLLDELAALDEQRGKPALEQGRIMLAAAKERAMAGGVAAPECRQRHGDLLESLRELESEMRLLVIGRQSESSSGLSQHVGSQLESVIRIMHRPILVTPTRFKNPRARCWPSMAAPPRARV